MANETKATDQTMPLAFPLKGVDVECAFDLQPPLTTPVAHNVRGFEPKTLRDRGGSRSGIVKFADQLPTGNSPLQHLQFIVDPQAAFQLSDDDIPVSFGGGFILDYIDDPSTNNLRIRNRGRLVPRHGSGRPARFNRPRVQRSAVTINWSDPADIASGTPLDATQLNATATSGILAVAGTFVYTPDSGTILGVGDHQGLRVNFTPTDEDLYKPATKTVHINVTAPTPPSPLTLNAEINLRASPSADFTKGIFVFAGDLLVFFIGNSNSDFAPGITIEIEDDDGNTYTQIETTLEEDKDSGEVCLAAFWTVAANTGTITVHVTADDPVTGVAFWFSGAHPTSPIRFSVSNTEHEASSPITVGPITAVSGDYLLADFNAAGGDDGDPVLTAVAPFISGGGGVNGYVAQYENAAASTTATMTFPGGATASYVAIGVSIRPAPP